MMKEKFVTFEQAVALKECGFDWECSHYYTPEDTTNGQQWFTSGEEQNYNEHGLTLTASAPTQALAQKWLRDVHNIHIQITYTQNKYWKWRTEVILVDDSDNSKMIDVYKDYESALAAGLDAALELIKQK